MFLHIFGTFNNFRAGKSNLMREMVTYEVHSETFWKSDPGLEKW